MSVDAKVPSLDALKQESIRVLLEYLREMDPTNESRDKASLALDTLRTVGWSQR